MPGPVRRALRSRLTAASTGLLALSLLASAGTGAGAAAQLQGTLDANWRGLYDLLVTAPGSAAELDGMLEPSSLASLSARMGPGSLERVRAVPGVELAAPLGTVTIDAGAPMDQLRMSVPIDAGRTTDDPQGYRITVTYRADDGLGPRVITEERYGAVVDDADLPDVIERTPAEAIAIGMTSCNINGVDLPIESDAARVCRSVHRQAFSLRTADGAGFSSTERVGDQLIGGIGGTPALPATIAFVDPVAERALLGDAGAFLDPLAALAGEQLRFADAARLVERIPNERTEAIAAAHQQSLELEAEMAADAAEERAALEAAGVPMPDGAGQEPPVVPVLVSPQAPGAVTATVRVERGFPVTAMEGMWGGFELGPEVFADAPGELVQETTVDVTAYLDPFATGGAVLPLLGGEPGVAWEQLRQSPNVGVHPRAVATASSLPYEERGDGIALTAAEYVRLLSPSQRTDGDRPWPQMVEGSLAGAEAIYRTLEERRPNGMHQMPTIVAIGDFDASAVDVDGTSLGYAPIGSFDRVSTTLVADGDGRAIEPVELRPPVTGFGFASGSPTWVADVANASQLRQGLPIASIRVRVAGVESGYTPENVQRVADVAQALVDEGFTVTMAAGSSRQDVPVFLDGYAFATADAAGTQTIGPLGTVQQQWPSLGAAQLVERSVAGATTGVLALAIGASALLFGVVQFAGIAPRRRDAAMLSRLGWRRGRIARRFAAEDAVSLGAIAVAGLGAIALMATQTVGGVHATTPWIVGAAVAAAVVIVLAALAGSVPRMRRAAPPKPVTTGASAARHGRHAAPPRPRMLARSTVGFGIGQAGLHLGHAITVLIAIVLIGLASAGAWIVVEQGVAAAGRTLLATASTAQSIGVQALLAAIGIVAGVVLVVLARRLDARVRAGQWRALGAMGWTSRRVWAARAVELVTVAVPAIAIAAALGWFGAPLVDASDPLPVALTAGGAALAALLLLLALQRTSPVRAERRKALP